MAKYFVHIVPHTHWDREWYFTSAKSKIYLVNNMKEILEMLETHKDYPCYVLDGQTVVLEDYLSLKPKDKDRIKNLVSEKRLKIGPWYTQTDEMVVGAESIVRNLLYGKLDCDNFGDRMMIGYLPDSFGQSGAMPKILSGFGIEKSLFWRGYSQRLGITQTEFMWESDDGSKVAVQLLPINYSVGITIPEDKEKIKERFDKAFKILKEFTSTNHLLVPNGHDQMPVQQNIYEVIELMREVYPDHEICLSSYEDLYTSFDENKIKTIKGELLDGKYMRAHRSIFSSRADIKIQNTQLENKITNVLEPIASIAYSLGFDYQAGTIETIWRNMLKNHAHDSIGCCCTDNVNREVAHRFVSAKDMADNLIEFYMRKVLENCDIEGDKLIVFNTLPYNRKECFKVKVSCPFENFEIMDSENNSIEFEIISSKKSLTRDESENYDKNYQEFNIAICDEIPAMGYKIYKIKESENNVLALRSTNENFIENDFYKVIINNNGTVNIVDKNNNITYKDVLLFEDSADGGDSYDYSPVKDDLVLTSQKANAKVKTIKGKCFEEAKISLRFELPKDLNSRSAKKIDAYADIEIDLKLSKNSKIIGLDIKVNNNAKDHRLRVLIPQNLTAQNSVADIQFGHLKRDVYDKALDVWESENWVERPDTIYPFLSYVHTSNNEGLGVISNSVREFEIIDGQNTFDTIAITLFRSFGFQGKRDLIRRPGRASGTSQATPDAQLIGNICFDLALTTDIENIAHLAKQYTSPILFYSSDPAEDLLLNKSKIQVSAKYSLLNIENSGIVLSALKKAEDREALCIRFYNSLDVSQKLNIESFLDVESELMLDETKKTQIKDCKNIEFKPFEVKTFLLKI